jgi:hypothetical protein
MVDTALSSLAQNLEGPDWPIKAPDETPSAYIDQTYEEMRELLALKGYPAHADLLISILKDTLAFDDPFGDMVDHTAAAAEKENQLLRNLQRLEIAEDFPIALTALDADTRDFCRLEKLDTLGAFARFAQTMAQSVIVGGDFRKLLNALSHVDEQALAVVLPFRPGAKGLHLIECLAQSDGTPGCNQAALAWFAADLEKMKADLAAGSTLERQLVVLNNPAAEQRVAAVLRPLLQHEAPVEKSSGLRGMWSRLFGR